MTAASETTLVVGGTGKTGRRVAERLVARGLPVRIASRAGTPRFDWAQPATWGPVLERVGAVYLAYAPDVAAPGAAERLRHFAQVAVQAGVRRLVMLSGRGEPQAQVSEDGVRESGVGLTVLRSAFFAQNFSEGHLLEPLLGGELAFPAGQVAEPFVDAEDLADVAVAALTDARHVGQVYELTGPRLLTFGQAVAEVSEAAGRPLRYVPITPQQYAEALAPYLPEGEAEFLAQLFSQVLDGHNAHLADGVQRALGRTPRDFRDFAREAAARGNWAQRAAG